jgi:hypothetical protein
MEDHHMTKLRTLLIVATLGVALLAPTRPAAAYVVEALTSISVDAATDKGTLEQAIQAALDDIAAHVVAFTPTLVSVREAKFAGDRIYLFVLFADAAGEAEIELMGAHIAPSGFEPR